MAWRLGVATGIFGAFVALSIYFIFFREGMVSRVNFSRIEEGMRLDEVFQLLGPTDEVDAEQVLNTQGAPDPDPKRRGSKVVGGDRFYQWPKGYDFLQSRPHIIIGFVEDKVWDKYWREPMP